MQPEITPEYLASQGLSPTFEDRFWDKVFIMTEGQGCWLWLASKHEWGYGQIGRWKQYDPPMRAHVASWILHYGPVPKGLCVCHKCDNPPCVRPDHLFLGTHKENSDDKIRKGRFVIGKKYHGEEHPTSKLTQKEVDLIRVLYSTGQYSQEYLSILFGTCQTNVSSIVRKESWI